MASGLFHVQTSRPDLDGKLFRQNKEDWKLSWLTYVVYSARDRIALLLDHDSPFLELGAFAGFGNSNSTPSGNLITGIGKVSGRPCMLMSHIQTQSGGAWRRAQYKFA
ncbi:hypothetical protein BJX99DRAFT_263263 [Aspergillus californicus]